MDKVIGNRHQIKYTNKIIKIMNDLCHLIDNGRADPRHNETSMLIPENY